MTTHPFKFLPRAVLSFLIRFIVLIVYLVWITPYFAHTKLLSSVRLVVGPELMRLRFHGNRFVGKAEDTHLCYHVNNLCLNCYHRLSINRPTKRGKENSPSDGHGQCEKKMDDHLLACQSLLKESHIVICIAKERTSFLKINDFNDISFFGTSDCHHCCASVSGNANSMLAKSLLGVVKDD
jgi:hypothetical protein